MFENLRAYLHDQPAIGSEHKHRINQLEKIIDTPISNPFLYVRALRHKSSLRYDSDKPTDTYERLEFLGDAVLDLIVSEIIFDRYPGKNEGFLTKLRSKLVKGDALAKYAGALGLSNLIILGEGARGQGIEFSKGALADVFEALLGALYIDQGHDVTARFVGRVLVDHADFKEVIQALDNYKSLLLEYAQAHRMEIPRYKVIAETGPDHDKTFESVAIVDDRRCCRGRGKSKKQSEQEAAKKTLEQLQSC